MSVHWPIIRRLLAHPLRELSTDDRKTWRGAETLFAAAHLADQLEKHCRSQSVAVLLPTSGAFPVAALASWWLGKTIVPLNYLLNPAEIEYIIRHAQADTVVTVQPMLDHLKWTPPGVTVLRLEDINFKRLPEPRIPAAAADQDVAAMLYTSGTSGRPKGVMLTHGNISANVRQIRNWVDFSPKDTLLGALPQFHSFGFTVLTMTPLTIGCRAVYLARYSPQRMITILRERRPTLLVAIPSMYNALLTVKSAAPEDFASLRYIVSGGEPLPEDVFQRFRERFNVTINEGYGLTETSPVTNWCRPHEFVRRSVGRAVPEMDITIADLDSGENAPTGREGEIRMKGPNIFAGYYRDPEATAAAFDSQGRFRTGDIGKLNAEGHLFITGRLKEMMIIAGENVFPREIEEILNAHPSVQDSGVVGVPDESRGEAPVAFVELAEGAQFDEQALRAWCRERMGVHKTPRQVVALDELPRGPTGKILRRVLAQRAAEQRASAAARA